MPSPHRLTLQRSLVLDKYRKERRRKKKSSIEQWWSYTDMFFIRCVYIHVQFHPSSHFSWRVSKTTWWTLSNSNQVEQYQYSSPKKLGAAHKITLKKTNKLSCVLAIIPRWDTIFCAACNKPQMILTRWGQKRRCVLFCFDTQAHHPPDPSVANLNCNISACRIFGHIPLFCFHSFTAGLLQPPPLWIWGPQYFLIRLQKVQNNAAHLIWKVPGKSLSSQKTTLHFIFTRCTGFQSMWESNTKLRLFASVQ